MPENKIDDYVAKYIAIRDRRREIKKSFDTEDKELRDVQELLAGRLRMFMDENKLENLKTAHGTCYTTTQFSASLADPDAFMAYVVANQKFDLLDRRANATAVKAFVEVHHSPPPGCNLSAIQQVGVRRKGEKE